MVGRWWRGAALAAVTTLLLTAAPGRAGSQAEVAGLRLGDGYGLTLLSAKALDHRLVELSFRTAALAAPTSVRILLPSSSVPSSRTRYPVLYLLHGGTGSYVDWTEQGDAEAITAGYPVIVVMPDGEPDGNYVNWYNNGTYGVPQWETFHIDQLLPWVDEFLPTQASRGQRAIAGLSMGGAGATHYAAASRASDSATVAVAA